MSETLTIFEAKKAELVSRKLATVDELEIAFSSAKIDCQDFPGLPGQSVIALSHTAVEAIQDKSQQCFQGLSTLQSSLHVCANGLSMVANYPAVQGGGSLILAWQIKNKNVLVVGGGEVAAGRVLNLLNADAKITVVCPREGLNDEVAFRIQQGQISHLDRVFLPIDLEPEKNVAMVLTAIDDPDASTRIWRYCKKMKVPANIADVPPECDFYFGSVHRDGPLQIMVSTNGNGPRMAAAIRRQIGQMLPPGTGDSIKKVGQLRRKLRRVAPGKSTDDISKRMTWMSQVCDEWSTDDFNTMDEEDMEELVKYYAHGTVPTFEDIRLSKTDTDTIWSFDGSFGWM